MTPSTASIFSGAPSSITYDVGLQGSGQTLLREGWSAPEAGYTWTDALRAGIALPRPAAVDDLRLDLTIESVFCPAPRPWQRVAVHVGTRLISSQVLDGPTTLSLWIDCTMLETTDSGVIQIWLEFPDAARPSDFGHLADQRLLCLSLSSITLHRLPAPRLATQSGDAVLTGAREGTREARSVADVVRFMSNFEALGESCEFALVQRRCGVGGLGLLRFASTRLPSLLAMLAARFDGLGRPDMLEVQLGSNGRDYMVLDRRFGLLYHTWVLVEDKTADQVHADEIRRVPLLVRKLVAELTAASKVFVFQPKAASLHLDASELLAALRHYGPVKLLWVELAGPSHRAGSVEVVADGFAKGYLDRIAPEEDAHNSSMQCWLSLCREADRLLA